MGHNYRLDEIKEDTETRFAPYFDLNNIDISFKKKELFEINIKIKLNPKKFKKELEELKQKDNKYNDADINKIIDQINFLTPTLTGYIDLEDNESHINIVKVGLFTSTTGDFAPIERDLIKEILGGQGIGALLVLMFIYVCYKFNEYNSSYTIENISLDDSSDYPGWYGKILFEYPDGDEVANLDLTPENYEKLTKKIFEYSKKNDTKKIPHIFNQIKQNTENLNLLADVAANTRGRYDRDYREQYENIRERERDGGRIRKKNKKTKKKKTKIKKNKKTRNKKNKKTKKR